MNVMWIAPEAFIKIVGFNSTPNVGHKPNGTTFGDTLIERSSFGGKFIYMFGLVFHYTNRA